MIEQISGKGIQESHANVRNCLAERGGPGSTLASAPNDSTATPSTGKYLILKGKAGMGNRMLVTMTAILYARLTRRQLIVDWTDPAYSNDRTNAFHHYFVSPDVDPAAPVPQTNSVHPAVWRGHLDKSANELIKMHDRRDIGTFTAVRRYSVDVRRTDYHEDLAVMWGYVHQIDVLRRHLRRDPMGFGGLSTEGILRKLLAEHLFLRPAIQRKVARFKGEQFGDTTVGVHVRYTDLKVPLKSYFKHVDRVIAANPGASIFLATDSEQVLNVFTERYRRVVSTPKAYPRDGRAMHANLQCEDRLANGVDALTDMYLLAGCDYLIYPGSSTFSYVSSLVADLPQERVVDVQRRDPVLWAKRRVQAWYLQGMRLFT